MELSVSVLTISKGNREGLIKTVNSVLREIRGRNDCEYIVVEAQDGLEPIEGVKYIRIPEDQAHMPRQWNIGVRESKGELIIFIDDDIRIEEGWLDSILEDAWKYDAMMVAVLPEKVDNVYKNALAIIQSAAGFPGGGFKFFDKAKGKVIKIPSFSTTNLAIKRKLFEVVGLFDERLYVGADADLCTRMKEAGFSNFAYTSKVKVYHRQRESLREIFRWMMRRGRGNVDVWIFKRKEYRQVLTSSLLFKIGCVLIASLVLSPLIPPLFTISASALAWVIVNTLKLRLGIKYAKGLEKLVVALLTPICKATMDIGTDVGRIYQFMRRLMII